MTKLSMLTTAASLAMAFAAPVAMAQTPSAHARMVLADHSMRASMLIGMKVLDDHGQVLGTVKEILVKDQAVEPTAIVAVLDLNALATRLVAVPLSHLKVEGNKVMMPGATKEMLVAMPLYDYEGGGPGR
nr:PRC-barrel domain-containing protein [uncultured Rhodopila sp.]